MVSSNSTRTVSRWSLGPGAVSRLLLAIVGWCVGLGGNAASGQDATGAQSDARLPVPAVAGQQRVLTDLREAFAAQLGGQSREEKSALARDLQHLALGFTNDPTGKYVYLCESLRLAREGVAVLTVLDVIDQLSDSFRVDRTGLLTSAVASLARSARLDDRESIASTLIDFLEREFVAGDGSVVDAVLRAGETFSLGLEAPALDRRWRLLDWRVYRQNAFMSASASLQEDPQDGGALESVGRYLCLVREDFDEGLKILVHTSIKSPRHKGLRRVSELDLVQQSANGEGKATVEALEAVGDAWLELVGPKLDEFEQAAVARRGLYWFELAEVHATGTSKAVLLGAKIQRAREVAAAQPALVSGPTTVPPKATEPSAVAMASISLVTIDIGGNLTAAFEYFAQDGRKEQVLQRRVLVSKLEDRKADRQFADHWRALVRASLPKNCEFARRVRIVVTRPHHPADHSLGTGNRCQWECQLEGGQAKLCTPCQAPETRNRAITK